MTWHVEQADALEYLRSLPSSSVDLVLTDPPYFKVKAERWCRQARTNIGAATLAERAPASTRPPPANDSTPQLKIGWP